MGNETTVGLCPECKTFVSEEIKAVIAEYGIPFVCPKCGGIKFPFKALNGIAFLWPKPIQEKLGSIFIPEASRDNFKTSLGVVLTVGKGCVEKRSGLFIEAQIVPGDVVLYDKNVPWSMQIKAPDGKDYQVNLMNILDINAIALR